MAKMFSLLIPLFLLSAMAYAHDERLCGEVYRVGRDNAVVHFTGIRWGQPALDKFKAIAGQPLDQKVDSAYNGVSVLIYAEDHLRDLAIAAMSSEHVKLCVQGNAGRNLEWVLMRPNAENLDF
jgi:hypothetical protein